jgi:hypothetical protein
MMAEITPKFRVVLSCSVVSRADENSEILFLDFGEIFGAQNFNSFG